MEVIVKIKWNKIKRLIKISKRELSIMKKNLQRKNLIVGGLFVKGTDGWRVRKIMKGAVAVTSIPSATAKRMLHYNKTIAKVVLLIALQFSLFYIIEQMMPRQVMFWFI